MILHAFFYLRTIPHTERFTHNQTEFFFIYMRAIKPIVSPYANLSKWFGSSSTDIIYSILFASLLFSILSLSRVCICFFLYLLCFFSFFFSFFILIGFGFGFVLIGTFQSRISLFNERLSSYFIRCFTKHCSTWKVFHVICIWDSNDCWVCLF